MKKYILIISSQVGASLVSYVGQYNTVFGQERMANDINIVSNKIKEKGFIPLLISYHENRYFSVSSLYKKLIDKDIIVTNLNQISKYISEIDGAVLIGISGRSGSGAFIDGTHNNLGWHDYYIDNKALSESELFAYYLGLYGVPIIFTTGCDIAIKQNKESFPWAFHVITKKTINRNLAKPLPENEINNEISKVFNQALDNIDNCQVLEVTKPLKIKIIFNRTDYCDDALKFGNYHFERLDARTLQKELNEINSFFELIY